MNVGMTEYISSCIAQRHGCKQTLHIQIFMFLSLFSICIPGASFVEGFFFAVVAIVVVATVACLHDTHFCGSLGVSAPMLSVQVALFFILFCFL